MLRLDASLRRHRRPVLVAWLVLLVAAVPLALRQSDNLTGGGFGVPGSEYKQVEDAHGPHIPQAPPPANNNNGISHV
jgi:RND superfamily putative drug exporter